MSCFCNVSRMYPYVEFRDRHTEKIEDLVVGHTGVFFTHHGVRYYKPNDSCKFCKLPLDLHGVTLRDLSDEFCCIVYDPDNPNDIPQSESSNFPCESCMHSHICKYKEDFEKLWGNMRENIACIRYVKGVL